MKLYDNNGYVNIRAILDRGITFNFVVGGRGTGKTFTALSEVVEEGRKFMFMRRTQEQADTINKPQFSPFKPVNRVRGWDIRTAPISKKNSAFYNGESDSPIGYTCALSTVATLRGFDASDVELLIYDEFIPEPHERPIKNEGLAFLNAYETINRNRELDGRKPLQVLALANSNLLANPVFMELGIVNKAFEMCVKKQELSIDEKRGIAIYLLHDSPISARKNTTALYKVAGDGDFSAMAINNAFARDDGVIIKSMSLSAYNPIVSVGEICIYMEKSGKGFYVSPHVKGEPVRYGCGSTEIRRFKNTYAWLWVEHLRGRIIFESAMCEILLTKYLK